MVGNGHDTFKPIGPHIVPKELFPNPMNKRQTLTVNGTMMQDARSSDGAFRATGADPPEAGRPRSSWPVRR